MKLGLILKYETARFVFWQLTVAKLRIENELSKKFENE